MTAHRFRVLQGLTVLALATLTGCSPPAAAPAWSGYVEGDYLYLAPTLGGRLDVLAVQAGQQVAAGAPLFQLDAEAERAARAETGARLKAALAQAANTDKGRRADEVAVNQAQLAQARAQAELLRVDLARQKALLTQGFVSEARLDDASSALIQARAHVAELEAALRVAGLPARNDERQAAQASADAASQALRQSAWRVEQKAQRAPAAGQISEVYFRVGEYVPAGQPVLSLLPPANRRARFFVPEAELAGLAPGQALSLSCDGCGAPIAARIRRISTQAEFTPPVIYSNAQRARLVFMVEAQPDADADALRLKPGQPLDVRRAEP